MICSSVVLKLLLSKDFDHTHHHLLLQPITITRQNMASLRLSPHAKPSGNGIMSVSFNQDGSCISIADVKGVRIYSIDQHALVYHQDLGSIRLAEMLFCTSLLAFVGSGEQPSLSPRKLTLLNTANRSVIQEFSMSHTVLGVLMNLKRYRRVGGLKCGGMGV